MYNMNTEERLDRFVPIFTLFFFLIFWKRIIQMKTFTFRKYKIFRKYKNVQLGLYEQWHDIVECICYWMDYTGETDWLRK